MNGSVELSRGDVSDTCELHADIAPPAAASFDVLGVVSKWYATLVLLVGFIIGYLIRHMVQS